MAMASITSDSEKRLLECMICYDRLKPPVVTCETGHAVCRNCREKMQICGLCKRKFTNSPNIFLNQLLETIHIECQFRSEGCFEHLSGAEIDDHEKNCIYRLVDCKFRSEGCPWSAPLTKIENHEINCWYKKTPCKFQWVGCPEVFVRLNIDDHEKNCIYQYRMVDCKFKSKGCSCCGSLYAIQEHENHCSYQKVQCKFKLKGCSGLFLRLNINDHEKNCNYRIVNCKFKSEGCSWCDSLIACEEHEKNCRYRKVQCKFRSKGCFKLISEKKIKDHEKDCDYKDVNCKFRSTGCSQKLIKAVIEHHEKSCGYRKLNCCWCTEKKIFLSQFSRHFREKHQIGTITPSEWTAIDISTTRMFQSKCYYVSSIKSCVLLRFYCQDILCLTVQYLGQHQENAEKCKYYLRTDNGAKDTDDTEPNTGFCSPYTASPDEALKQKKRATVRLRNIKKQSERENNKIRNIFSAISN